MHKESGNLQAEKRAMGVSVAREDRPEGGYLARLVIDNASKLNALNRELMVEIVEAVKALEVDPELPQLIGYGRARRLLLTGVSIDADEALAWALVDAVVPPDRLDPVVERFAAAILAGGPHAIRLQKKLILDWEELPTGAAVARGIEIFAEAYATDEPRRMAEAQLATMRARRSPNNRRRR